MSIGGLDIGTTGCKITVYNEKGEFLYKSYKEYDATRTSEGHELSGETVWASVKEVIADAADNVKDINSIGVTSFGESFVIVDENDNILMPSMLYTDPRGAQECASLVEKLGKEFIIDSTALNPHSMYSLPKIMWIKNNMPEIYGKAKHILLYQDFIVYMLSGTAQIDYSLATRAMAFDLKSLDWNDDILKAAGIEKELLSKPVPSGTSAGKVRPNIAEALGLSQDTIIVSCCHDQLAAAIGAGAFESGTAVDGTGTVECIIPVFDNLPDLRIMSKSNYAVVPHVIKNKYVCYAFSYTGGALLKWYRDNFAQKELELAAATGKSVYTILESKVKDDPSGILVLPHFAGAATPYMDSGSKGCISGVTLEHTSMDIYKALMEGVTYEMMLNIELLSEAGIKINHLKATGGGSLSKVWLQIKSDLLNIPMISLGESEIGAMGSVILAGIATGVFNSLESASDLFLGESKAYYPRKDQHDKYMELYDKYKNLYNSVRPLF